MAAVKMSTLYYMLMVLVRLFLHTTAYPSSNLETTHELEHPDDWDDGCARLAAVNAAPLSTSGTGTFLQM